MPSNSRAKAPLDVHERALRLLAVRPRSRRELERRLAHAGFEQEEVEPELARLEAVGLIDDEDFARRLAEHELAVRRSGARAVRQRLLEKGVDREIVERTLTVVPAETEFERALELARRQAARIPRYLPPQKTFGRLMGMLTRRGYSSSVAREAVARAMNIETGDD
jgi:regulatory protein